jgi:hypothetical protein
MTIEDGKLRVEVFDGDCQMPAPVQTAADATSGRGLGLVGALSSTWGAEARSGGKVVWAELSWRSLGEARA